MQHKRLILAIFITIFSGMFTHKIFAENSSSSQGAFLPSNIIGVWQTTKESKNARIDINYCEGSQSTLCGKIVWLQEPTYEDNTPKVDRNNPDPTLQKRALIGLTLVSGFKIDPKDPNNCSDGSIYNPENGKTYTCSMTLESNGTLEVRGYIGIPLFGESQTWVRVNAQQ